VARRIWSQALSLLVAALMAGAFAFMIYSDRKAGEEAQRAEAATRAARSATWNALSQRGDLEAALARCRDAWAGDLSFHHAPLAIAFSRDELDAYFVEGNDRSSLRQVRCEAQGVSRGPRVAHPLHALLPAEASTTPAGATGDEWVGEMRRLAARTLDAGDLAIELAVHPATGGVVVRRWRSGPRGPEAVLEPAETPPFALLIASTRFRPGEGMAPPPLQALARNHWLLQTEQAFALLGRELPKGARVSELRIEDEKIELQIDWPTAAFDGDPPAPYGDKSFDEYGVADMDWWYPRTEPGFGCRTGQDLAAVRAAFDEAMARLGGQALGWAWYSCSTAYGNGRTGAWHLQRS